MKTIKYLPLSMLALAAVNAQTSDIHAKDFLPMPKTSTVPTNDDKINDTNLSIYPFPRAPHHASSMDSLHRDMLRLEETVDELRSEVSELKTIIFSLIFNDGDEKEVIRDLPIFSRCVSRTASDSTTSRACSSMRCPNEKTHYNSVASSVNINSYNLTSQLMPTTPPPFSLPPSVTSLASGIMLGMSESNVQLQQLSDSSFDSDEEQYEKKQKILKKERQQKNLSKRAQRIEHFRQMAYAGLQDQ